MTITDESRFHLHRRLAEVLGSEEASTLMEHLPPVGWADVATRRDLDHAGAVLDANLDARFAQIDIRFAQIDARFAQFDANLEARFAQIDTRFAQIDARFAQFDTRLAELRADLSRQMLATTLAANSVLVALVFAITRLSG